MSCIDDVLHESLVIVSHEARRLADMRARIARSWKILDIDLRGLQDKAMLHKRFAAVCEVPAWYGTSWDSLLSLLPAVPDDLEIPRMCLWIQAAGLEDRLLEVMLAVISSALSLRYTRLRAPIDSEIPGTFDEHWMSAVCVVDSVRTERPGLATEVRSHGGAILLRRSWSPLLLLGEDDPGAGDFR